jgi:predicted O-methyltransferase YrrM
MSANGTFRSAVRAVPGASALNRRLRNGWRRVQPYPHPKYLKDTPTVGSGDPLDVFCPPTALTLAEAAMSPDAARRVEEVIECLTPSKDHIAGKVYYAYSQAKFGKYWRHADLPRMLWAAATFIRPQAYLEIGVWRGRSAAVLASVAPDCAIYGFDMWIPNYYGTENPGPEFVEGELKRVGHRGHLQLVSGDSRKTLPQFLDQHPNLFFDIISIDGDKSIAGCGGDFANALPRLKRGGVVIFDDIPSVPSLNRLWDDLIRRDQRYTNWDFNDAGFGVSVAVRSFA